MKRADIKLIYFVLTFCILAISGCSYPQRPALSEKSCLISSTKTLQEKTAMWQLIEIYQDVAGIENVTLLILYQAAVLQQIGFFILQVCITVAKFQIQQQHLKEAALVSCFCSRLNSTNIEWKYCSMDICQKLSCLVIKYSTHIHVPLWMNFLLFHDRQTSIFTTSTGQNVMPLASAVQYLWFCILANVSMLISQQTYQVTISMFAP